MRSKRTAASLIPLALLATVPPRGTRTRGPRSVVLRRGLAAASAIVLGLAAAYAVVPLRIAHVGRLLVPRGSLWLVDQACVADQRVTGHPFPCREVVTSGAASGHVVVRAPFSATHEVVVPIQRMAGIEDAIRDPAGASDALSAAWAARGDLDAALGGGLGSAGVALAVNSALTRSQDQLHVHVGCLAPDVPADLASQRGGIPSLGWGARAFVHRGHLFWARRVDASALAGGQAFRLMREIREVAAEPARAILAVLGDGPAPSGGAILLVALSDPTLGRGQFTSESLLDHGCVLARGPTSPDGLR